MSPMSEIVPLRVEIVRACTTPLLLTTVLAANWRDETLHQRLH